MATLETFYRTISETGGYTTPADRCKGRRARGLRAGVGFYLGALGGVVRQGLRELRRNSFTNATLGELAWGLMDRAEGLGAMVTFEGFESLAGIRERPAVLVANHMSLIETMVLPAGIFGQGPMIIVAKRSLIRYPWFGRVLEASQPILVERKNPRQDLSDVMEQGCRALAGGRSVLLFPQGTRMTTFDPRYFNSLGAKLARRAGAPLIPIACKTDFARPGRLLKDFGPIDPERPIKFAAGPRLDSSLPQRELQEECTRHIVTTLRAWQMPVIEAVAEDKQERREE